MTETFQPRPRQKEVLSYRGGKMGVSAVPGSGKTWTLSRLAADLILLGEIDDDQEILIVTLVNSAVDNFTQRVSGFIQKRGLLPHMGYRVRTLHGLAHEIVRGRPDLAGLSKDFQIIDEHTANQIQQEAAAAWLRGHPQALDGFLRGDLDEGRRRALQRRDLPGLVAETGSAFIRYAKDMRITPEALLERLAALPIANALPLAEMGVAIYADYQRALAYRGAVDFDDLIRLALQTLQSDERYLEELRDRWPYILEDEAQDSSRLQEEILRLLAGPSGNWVRVGDPNQAIYETFTTANPAYLRNFLKEAGVAGRTLPNSGRSTISIINLANYLIEWTLNEHPVEEVRSALSLPFIQPTPPGDPQPNPPMEEGHIYFSEHAWSPEEEIAQVAASIERWLPAHPEATVAVLAPRNKRGSEMVEELQRRKIDCIELLGTSSATRLAAGNLQEVLAYIADPQSSSRLARVYKSWRDGAEAEADEKALIQKVHGLLRKCSRVEEYLAPRAGVDWLETYRGQAEIYTELQDFRRFVERWQGTALLPIDQAILTIAQDLFTEPNDLAVAHKLAVMLRQSSQSHADWRLPELSKELDAVAQNRRRFLGFNQDETGFDPEQHRGRVVVSTIHKAKGLEWDRVYLLSANTYDFPGGAEHDQYIAEKWYLRDRLNLSAEALEQLEVLFSTDPYRWYQEGEATRRARLEYAAERLRLLYVGITRAKKDLWISWNQGRYQNTKPTYAFQALRSFWEVHG